MGERSCGVQLGDHPHPWHCLPQVQLQVSAAWVAPGAAAASSGADRDFFSTSLTALARCSRPTIAMRDFLI